ncbi:MAG: cytochrome c [Myxococcota bacterium]
MRVLNLPRLLILGGAVVCASALAQESSPRPLQGDLVRGKELYDAHCMSCHGANGMGGKELRLSDSNLLNARSDTKLLDLIREGDSSRPKKSRHFKLPGELGVLDAWDIIGFLRSRTIEVPVMVPDADRYLAIPYTPDEFGLERLQKTTGQSFKPEDSKFTVYAGYKTGWGGQTSLLPADPKVLDKLKRNMKVGYVVVVPLSGQKRETEVVLTLEPKNLSIVRARAITMDGMPDPELDKQLQRFEGKGDRRVSGQPKATLKVGGGGKNFAALETQVTEAFVRAAECVTAFEVQERDRSWADDDF